MLPVKIVLILKHGRKEEQKTELRRIFESGF